LHFDFIGSHVAHLNRDCASRRSSPNQYPGAIVVKQHLFLPLAAIILASSVWASASSSSGIRISTAALSFDGSSGNVTSLPITLTVTGSQPVTITSATYSNGNFFSTPINLPVTLPSGQSITGQISARPQSTPQTGKFTIVSNVGTYTVSLSETATAKAPAASKLTFSAAALSFNGSSNNVSSQPLTMTVTGSQPVTITSATYSNGNFFSTPINLPVTLPSGQSITGQISARPQSTPQTGKFTIVSNVGTYTISLSETPAAQAPTSYQVNLTWKAPASSSDPVDSYQVNRAVAGSTAYSTVGTTTAGSTTFADTSVKAGTTYQYEVRSVDDQGGTSGPSNPITLAIP
jgi:hypothetical protein